MPVYANQSNMKVIPYRKVGERQFVHHFPGTAMLVDISRFLSQVFTTIDLVFLFTVFRFIQGQRNSLALLCGR